MKLPPFKLSRGTLGLIAVSAGLLIAGIWWSSQQHSAAARAERQLRVQQTQWRSLADSDPAPTAAVVSALEREVAAAREVVARLRQQLGESARDPVQSGAVPAARADAFFALARFMEEQNTQAAAAEVEVVAGESFGFSAHRNSGPADAHIELVHHQMTATALALNALWRAKPTEFIQVQRENPLTKRPMADGAAMGSGREGRPQDWLDWPAGRSLARAGILDTLALRFSWVGHTSTLRAWLQELGDSAAPLIVREVSVEPLSAGGRPAGGRRGLADLFRDESVEVTAAEDGEVNVIPLIDENRAVFHVTLEYLDFDPAPVVPNEEEEMW
jgi:hypothetical protein